MCRIYTESLGERDIDSAFTQEAGISSVDTAVTSHDITPDSTVAGRCIVPVLSQESGGSVFHTTSQDVGIGPVDSPDEIEEFEDDMIW